MKKKTEKILIGSTDHISLPELNLENIPCKIDTGAFTSTLHCSKIHLIEKDGAEILSVNFYDPKFHILNKKEFRFTDFKEKKVRSSNGEVDFRYSIQTPVVIFNKRINTEFTLSFREKMKFPILLGKRFLRKKFIVDVSLTNLNSKKLPL